MPPPVLQVCRIQLISKGDAWVPAHQDKGPPKQRSAMTSVLDNRLISTFRSTGGAIILYSFMVISLGLGYIRVRVSVSVRVSIT